MSKKISYDGIFKELIDESPNESIIELINNLFEVNYSLDCEVQKLATESHIGGKEQRSDILFRIDSDMYHAEVQSNDHNNISLRVFQYSYRAALLHGKTTEKGYLKLDFPKSVVFYLRSDEKTPKELTIELNLPDGNTALFKIPTKHLKEYKPQELIDKSMLAFIPHYPMTFDDNLDEKALKKLKESNQIIVDGIANKAENGEIDSRIAGLTISGLKAVNKEILTQNKINQKEVDEIMEAIERRFNLDPLNWEASGRAKGKAEGKEEDAKKMFIKGFSFEDIQDITGLKTEILQKIQFSISK